MVLGLRTKTHKSLSSVHLDYVIHVDDVKPWPPSQSLRTLRAVLIQWEWEWEQGERASSGFTNQVVPGDGRIELNQSFRLMREVGGGGGTYQNKCIEFNLYELAGRNKGGLKGQLLGSAVLDLDLGVVKENMICINTPIQCKRTYRNSVQPLLFLKIQPVEREASMERNHGESVSEYAEEAEIASFTTDDDDVSSHSSLPVTAATSPSVNKKKAAVNNNSGRGAKVDRVPHLPDEVQATESSSIDSSSDISSRIKPSISTLSKASRAERDRKADKHLLVAGSCVTRTRQNR